MSQATHSPISGTIQELRQAKSMVEQVTASLESQKEILKQRNMNLPPMILSTLNSMRADLAKLETRLVEEQTELGQLRALADMSAGVTTSLDVDTVLEEAMDIVIALTRAERGYIILLSETDEYIYRVRRDTTRSEHEVATRKPEVSTTILKHVIETREPLLADNAFQDARLAEGASIANYALRSVLCVPLTYKDGFIGMVYVDNRLQAGLFTEREKQTLTAFANTAAVAITNARYYADIQKALAEITSVQKLMNNVFESIGSGLIATDDTDIVTIFNRAAETILAISSGDTIGQSLQHILPKITADLHEHLTTIRDMMESQSLEAEIPRLDGEERVVLTLKLSPLRDKQEKVQGVAIVMDDVTAKREQEQQLRIMKTYLPPEMVDQIHEISKLALGGVRLEVTCLFAEVRPLYTLKDVTPRQLMELLNEYLSVAADCVTQTRGIVDKYMGTELMALWNTQLNPLEDHAKHALDCALMLRDRFIEMYQAQGINPEPHWYRIGIHTGVATLGNVGSFQRRDFTAIGDTINLAKRLEENTSAGQIILSEDSYQQFLATSDSSAFRFESRPAILGKGKSVATPVYEVFRHDA
jgi:PAS domain S-box-containing protein